MKMAPPMKVKSTTLLSKNGNRVYPLEMTVMERTVTGGRRVAKSGRYIPARGLFPPVFFLIHGSGT